MKYVDEYRTADAAKRYAEAIARAVTRPWTIMEVCGGQTHAIVRFGLDQMLPPGLSLLHGPGCPVCVTPAAAIDQAIAVAMTPGAILCSFGDMVRVPGTGGSLLDARARGGDVRVLYSPLDALAVARAAPEREVVFFAVGFETTAPATAMLVLQAERAGLRNLSLLVSHVLVPPAIEAILAAPDNRVQGFLAAGHVCTVMGVEAYGPIARNRRVPIVVTGFEPLDLLQGIHMCVRQLEAGRCEVENQYSRTVRPEGNPAARRAVDTVFEIVTVSWRGIGAIAQSGLALSRDYTAFDARGRFALQKPIAAEDPICIAGDVLRGRRLPHQCPAYAVRCTPDHPLGAPMVSSEGACAAYFRYRDGAAAARAVQG
ncbi:hydrogenase expression/formation protein HypD [Constrictibacter sp. MBR-5]|uniref:hydrogenase formation protein HypD n=1 Tax=Constrictibacter sp. MBR-5 TaxID=3156467 RepID=UPI003396F58E